MAKTNSKEIFEELPILKAIRIMAVPTIFSQIIILIYNLADTFFVGRTNNPYMVAGASLVLPVFNICLSLAGLTGVGGGALISRLLGENKEDEAKKGFVLCFPPFNRYNCPILNRYVNIYEPNFKPTWNK